MTIHLDRFLKLSTHEVAQILNNTQDWGVVTDIVNTLGALSLEQKKILEENHKFQLGALINEIVDFSDKKRGFDVLALLLERCPLWHEECPSSRNYPLHLALRKGLFEIFDLLMQHGACPTRCVSNHNLLHVALQACVFQDNEHQALYVQKALDTKAFDTAALSNALIGACEKGLLGAVQTLIQNGANLSMEIQGKGNALTVACNLSNNNDSLQMARSVLTIPKAGSSINKFVHKETPVSALCRAAQHGNVELMELLVEHGASVHYPEPSITPMMLACFSGHHKALIFLLQQGANPCARDNAGQMALHWLVSEGHTTAQTSINEDEDFALKQSMVDTLLQAGCDLLQKDKYGLTCIDLAQFHKRRKLSAYFLSKVLGEQLSDTIEDKNAQGKGYVALKKM